MMKFAVSVVIVNWNAGEQLLECITSLSENGGGALHEVVVVDNGSSDNSLALLGCESEYNFRLRIVRTSENLGFGKACNLGVEQTSADYLLFLNPDAAIYPGALEKVLKFMRLQENRKIGICGVQLVDETGHIARSCTRFPTPIGLFAHAVGLDRFIPRWGHFMSEWPHDKTRDVDHVIGAFYLVRREVFEQVGGFDERFFVYLEDLDFSYRAHRLGWRSIFLAEVQSFHAGGGTSNQVKARRLFYSLRSRLLYAHKHFGLIGTALVFAATLLLEPLSRTAYALLRGSWSSVKETFGGYAMLWRWLPQWIFKGVTR